jgi:hypothetical protein
MGRAIVAVAPAAWWRRRESTVTAHDSHSHSTMSRRTRLAALRRHVDLSTQAPPLSAACVRASLPPRSSLIDLFVESRYDSGRFTNNAYQPGGLTEPVVRAWITRGDRDSVVPVNLGPARHVRAFARGIGARESRRSGSDSSGRSVGQGRDVRSA